jgi:hypothetical protein
MRRILGLPSFDPVLQELNRRYEAERRMTTTAGIEHLNVFKQVRDGVLMGSVAALHGPVRSRLLKKLTVGAFPTISFAVH